MSRISVIPVVILLFALAPAHSADVEGLNSARVTVADRSDAEFKRGIARALAAVIVKLTGDSAAPRSKSGRGVVGQAQRLVQQFGYETGRTGTPDSAALMLRVEFDARVLAGEMRSRNLVVWGKERPDTLVWLIVDDPSGRRLFGAHDDNAMIRELKARAYVRGIPLVFPLADIGETSVLAGAASASELEEALRASSQKYGVRSILIGHLRQATPGLWENQWKLRVDGEPLKWEQQGDLIELLVEEATDSLADALGRRYAAPALHASADAVILTVQGLTSPQDYARTERYLRTLDNVTTLLVRRVDEQGIVFDLTVHGGLIALTQTISFGQTLIPDPSGAAVFRLNPI